MKQTLLLAAVLACSGAAQADSFFCETISENRIVISIISNYLYFCDYERIQIPKCR